MLRAKPQKRRQKQRSLTVDLGITVGIRYLKPPKVDILPKSKGQDKRAKVIAPENASSRASKEESGARPLT